MTTSYVLAGYRVATKPNRQHWRSKALPNGELISISDCIVDLIPAEPHGLDDWFDSETAAKRGQLHAPYSETNIIVVGIAEQDVEALLDDVEEGGWGDSAGSLPQRLARGEPVLSNRDEILGFELIGYDSGTWHSWICLDLADDIRHAIGVQPGRWGLIQDEQEARRAAIWLTESNLGDPKVSYWVAAMLTSHRHTL